MKTLERLEWRERAIAHENRLARYVTPHLARREARVAHPVHDFLFTYYNHSPAALLRWDPGFGSGLLDAPEYTDLKGYADLDGVWSVHPEHLASQQRLIRQIHGLLLATHRRPPTLGCFGLHEWAMVYRADTTRHPRPLRLGGSGTDRVVETHRISCSHFDAFRFFTEPARPLNQLRPGRDDRDGFEQPGCLHGGMDLYKHAFRLSPLVCSDLVADAFELAWEIRVLDMRAAPYDLTGMRLDPSGEEWTPVRIETPEGKLDYSQQQKQFAERGQAIRATLIAACEALIATAGR